MKRSLFAAVACVGMAAALSRCGGGAPARPPTPAAIAIGSATSSAETACPAVSDAALNAAQRAAADARVVSEQVVADSGSNAKIVSRRGLIATTGGHRALMWDADLRPVLDLDLVETTAHLGISHDGAALALAGGTNRPTILVDAISGRSQIVSRPPRFLYDPGVQEIAPSGLQDLPWLAIDAYDLVLLSPTLDRSERLLRSTEQQRMVNIDKTVRQLDYMDKRQGERGELWNLRTTGDDRYALLLAVNNKRTAKLLEWEIASRKLLPELALPSGMSPSTFAVSDDASFVVLAASSQDGSPNAYRITLAPASERGRILDLGAIDYGSHLALSPDGNLLLAVSQKRARWWSMQTSSRMQREPVAHLGPAEAAAITDRHIVLRRGNQFEVFDRRTAKKIGALSSPGVAISNVRRLPDGTLALKAGGDVLGSGAFLYHWSPANPQSLEPLGPNSTDFFGSDREGRLMQLVARGNCAFAQPLGSGSPSASWKVCASSRVQLGRFGKDPIIQAVDFANRRAVLNDGLLKIVGDKSVTLRGSQGKNRISHTAFSPGGRYVTAVMEPQSVVPEVVGVWEADSGKLLHQLRVDKQFAGMPQVSRDDRRLLIVFGDKAHLFELPSGKKLKTAKLPGWAASLDYDSRLDLFEVVTHAGAVVFDANLDPASAWQGWRISVAPGGNHARFFASGNELLATLELRSNGHVIYTPSGTFATSGPAPDHLHWFYPHGGRTTELAQLPTHNDPARIAKVLRDASRASDHAPPFSAPDVKLIPKRNDMLRVEARSPTLLTDVEMRFDGRSYQRERPCAPEANLELRWPRGARQVEVIATDSRGTFTTEELSRPAPDSNSK